MNVKHKLNETNKTVNLILLLKISIVLFFHLWTKRGLSLDGAHNLIRMTAEESFYFLELSRQSVYFFQQLPAYLMIRYTNFSSLELLTVVFSFGLIWIPILSLLGCFLILPDKKKQLIFFPLLFFIIGLLPALGVSVSAGLSVAGYLWPVVFMIYYSDLSKISRKFFFLLTPLPLILSHEMMSYMAPFLIFLCVIRLQFIEKTKLNCYETKKKTIKSINKQNKHLILIVISYLLFICFLAWFFIFFPKPSELPNRSEFFNSLLKLEFFFKYNEDKALIIYPAAVTAGLILAFAYISLLKKSRIKKMIKKILYVLLFVFGGLSILTPFNSFFPFFKLTGEEELRVWTASIALPLCLLLWYLYEKQTLKIDKAFIKAVLFAGLALSLWRIGSDYQFYKTQKQISKRLENCSGIIPYDKKTAKRLSSLSGSLYHISSYSLLLQNKIQSIYSLEPKNDIKLSKLAFNNKQISSIYKKKKSVCYFGEKSYAMCRFFNLEKLNESRFFNLEQLIHNVQYGGSGCQNHAEEVKKRAK